MNASGQARTDHAFGQSLICQQGPVFVALCDSSFFLRVENCGTISRHERFRMTLVASAAAPPPGAPCGRNKAAMLTRDCCPIRTQMIPPRTIGGAGPPQGNVLRPLETIRAAD